MGCFLESSRVAISVQDCRLEVWVSKFRFRWAVDCGSEIMTLLVTAITAMVVVVVVA